MGQLGQLTEGIIALEIKNKFFRNHEYQFFNFITKFLFSNEKEYQGRLESAQCCFYESSRREYWRGRDMAIEVELFKPDQSQLMPGWLAGWLAAQLLPKDLVTCDASAA